MFSEKVVDTIAVQLKVTEILVEAICITALEGGISYWAVLDSDEELYEQYKQRHPDAAYSQIMTRMLLDGKTFKIYDAEDWNELLGEFTLPKLLKGLQMYVTDTGEFKDLEYLDANACDSIFQYGLFGELVYG